MTLLEPGSALEPAAPPAHSVAGQRRRELAEFLRTRRARLSPEAVGLPPGPRRRTPGLRREEVAQEAGVGLTWYTWLEQGRPIKASSQVLEAVARALRLDEAERAHLFVLAGVGPRRRLDPVQEVPDSVLEIVQSLDPLPAMLLNERLDVLATNRAQSRLHRLTHGRACGGSNTLLCLFLDPEIRTRYLNFDEAAPAIVAVLRASFVKHLGEPAWADLVDRLNSDSPYFAELWARHDVARPGPKLKHLAVPGYGDLRLLGSSLNVVELPTARILVHTPADEVSRERLTRILAG